MSRTEPPPVPGATVAEGRARGGFRRRVFGLLAALLVGAVLTGLVVQRAVLHTRLERQVDEAHDQERTELETLATGIDPRTGEPFGGDVEAIFSTFLARNVPRTGELYVAYVGDELLGSTPSPVALERLPRTQQSWLATEGGARGWAETPEGDLRWSAAPIEDPDGSAAGMFVTATFVEDQRREIDDALRIEAIVSLAVLLVALAVAWVLAGRLLRPVRAVTDNARALSESDLSARIPVSGDDEIADLARTYNAMLDRLETAFETQRRFVDDAGHELRTPITIVAGHLELMGDDPDERRETIALVTDELDRMARIVNDLLLLAKAEQPDFLRPAPLAVDRLTRGLLDRSRALGDRTWVLDASADATVIADEQRITQAVLNLARNAVEHTDPGAEIGLGSRLEGTHVEVWVRDTGPGVPETERDAIFARFARGGGPRRADGAGLGLAIVRAVAEAHDGTVSVGPVPGGGARFTLRLPRARVTRTALAPPVAADPTPSGLDDPTHPALSQEDATWPAS